MAEYPDRAQPAGGTGFDYAPVPLHWRLGALGHDHFGTHSYGPRDLLRTLFRRWPLIALFSIGVMIVVVLTILSRTPTYEAHASILLKKGTAQEPLSPRPAPMTVWYELREEDINTEIGILGSRALVREAAQVLADAEPTKPPAWTWLRAPEKAAADQDPLSFERLVDAVLEALVVEQAPRSNIIQLRFLWPDPDQAQRFLEALVDNYQLRRSELFEPTGAEPFFRRQAEAAAAELKATEASLHAYLNEAGITLIEGPEGQDTLAAEKESALERQQQIAADLGQTRAQISQLDSLVHKTQSQILAEAQRVHRNLLERQRAALRGQLASIDRDKAEQQQRLVRLRELREETGEKLARIRVLEDRLRGLLLHGKPSVNANRLKKEVDDLYEQLAELGQVKRYDLNVGQDTNLYERLETEVLDTEVTLTGLNRRAEVIQEQLDALSERQAELKAAPSPLKAEVVWENIEATRQALAQAGAQLDTDDRRSLSEGFESLVHLLLSTEAELAGARARTEDLEKQASEVAGELASLNVNSVRARELHRQLLRNEQNYQTYVQKSETAAISAAMAREELVNTSVAEPPTVATDPVGPSKKTLLLLGLLVSAFGGAGIVFLLDFIDHRIDTPDQLERRLGLDHLASVPEGATEGPLDIGLAALYPDPGASSQPDRSIRNLPVQA